jgi:pantoate--beta-alanine ligase
MRCIVHQIKKKNKTIGFVPTMGCFHEGHLSLFRRARKKDDVVIVSLYVNLTQFAPSEDLQKYPRNFKRDFELARKEKVDYLFCPSDSQMYPRPFSTFVSNEFLSNILEGKSRPTHFRGVLTVLTKLFHLVEPDTAYFGQKDYQQAFIVQKMARELNFNLKIKVLPTVREKNGLAMSSRNLYLTPSQRNRVPALFSALQQGRDMVLSETGSSTEILKKLRDSLRRTPGIRLDYLEMVDPETLEKVKSARKKTLLVGAVWVGKTRLIDNLMV